MGVRRGLRVLIQLGALWGIARGLPARAAEATPALADSQLVATLHQVNQIEVQAGQLAQQNGSGPRVRRYGRTLIREHRRADQQLRQYARSSQMDVAVPPPAAAMAELNAARRRLHNLQSLHGSVFDQDFADVTIQTNKRTIRLVNNGRRQTADRRFKAMLGQVALQLRQHQQMAGDLVARSSGKRATGRLRLAGRASHSPK
jgi:putative membrane protein